MMVDTDKKINECIRKSLNYLSAIGRPIVLKCEQRISIQHLLLGKDVILILPTGSGKSTIFTVYALAKVSWELFCSPWRKNTKQFLNWHVLLHCKPAKSIINNSRSDWFSKANKLVWAEPCTRWAELKMLSFWAGGISSFSPCARKYRLLRRLAKRMQISHDALRVAVQPIDLKIENLDRVSIPAKSVAAFDIRHPIHGTTYGVWPRSAFEAVSVHFSLCRAI